MEVRRFAYEVDNCKYPMQKKKKLIPYKMSNKTLSYFGFWRAFSSFFLRKKTWARRSATQSTKRRLFFTIFSTISKKMVSRNLLQFWKRKKNEYVKFNPVQQSYGILEEKFIDWLWYENSMRLHKRLFPSFSPRRRNISKTKPPILGK